MTRRKLANLALMVLVNPEDIYMSDDEWTTLGCDPELVRRFGRPPKHEMRRAATEILLDLLFPEDDDG